MLPVKADLWDVFHCKSFNWGKFGFFTDGGGAAPSQPAIWAVTWGVLL